MAKNREFWLDPIPVVLDSRTSQQIWRIWLTATSYPESSFHLTSRSEKSKNEKTRFEISNLRWIVHRWKILTQSSRLCFISAHLHCLYNQSKSSLSLNSRKSLASSSLHSKERDWMSWEYKRRSCACMFIKSGLVVRTKTFWASGTRIRKHDQNRESRYQARSTGKIILHINTDSLWKMCREWST